MQLLGSYQSQLTTWYYQGLLNLLKQAVQLGDYSGNTTFDTDTVQALITSAQSFNQLPVDSVGSVVTDDYLNNPLQLLAIRFASLAQEVSSFTSTAEALISIIKKDSTLLEQLLNAGSLDAWCKSLPQVGGAQTAQWDFAMGLGKVSSDISLVDPNTGVLYTTYPNINTYLPVDTGQIGSCLSPNSKTKTITVNNLTWNYANSSSQIEELSGPDWTELSFLEPAPEVLYLGINAEIQLPTTGNLILSDWLQFSGSTPNGLVPTYLRILFTPRQVQRTFTGIVNGTPIVLSANGYSFSLNNVNVFSDSTFYSETFNYTLDAQGGTLTPIDLPSTVTIMFTEMYPAYQCSVNGNDWSDPIMLDINRPYPDNATKFEPISWGPDQSFPVTDEEGNATGIYMTMVAPLQNEFYLEITATPNPNVGLSTSLTVQFDQPTYMTGIHLSTFTTYPAILTSLAVMDFDTSTNILQSPVTLDRELTITFPRQIIREATLTFYQPNYTFKTYTVTPPDEIRRNIMAQIQPLLPYTVQRTAPPNPISYTGCLYEFGFENIYGEDVSTITPTVFVSGPYLFDGSPEVMRFDALTDGTISSYLCYKAYDGNDSVVDENTTGILITPGTAMCFPLSEAVNRLDIDHTNIWIKFVHRSSNALVEKFLLQVTTDVQ